MVGTLHERMATDGAPVGPKEWMPGSTRTIRAGLVAASTLILLVALGFGPVSPVLASGPRPAVSFLSVPAPSRTRSVHRMPFAPPTLTFYGHGYGHGLGMSQYGARGRALAGQTVPTILAHYYQGTTLSSVNSTAPVRVLVLSPTKATSAKPIVLHGRGAPFTIDGFSGPFPIGARVTIWPSGSGFAIRVTSTGGTVVLNRTTAAADLRLRSGADPGRIEVDTKPVADDTYRGVIRLLNTSSGVIAVNEVGLDLYLRGVVPAEMPASWPTEALKAQAIAARSYAEEHVHVGSGSYDLFDDTRSQVYHGSLGETTATNAIVTATAGQVLKSGSAIINALYHSADGGATENNENVYTSLTGQIVSAPLSYLRGSSDRDPNGVSYDSSSPHATWHTASYTWAQLSVIFATDARTDVGALTSLDLTDKGVSGRPIKVLLTGSLGTKTVSAEIFREVFNTGSPAADPYMWSTLVDTAPIP
jgi:stage II sporulation protein D